MRRAASRPRQAAGLAGVVALVLVACSAPKSATPTTQNTAPVNGGAIVDLQNFAAGVPDHIDPALTNDVQAEEIASLLYDGLTKTDAQGIVQNAVATAVTPNADGSVWTFKLNPDVKFDNGDLVLPSDFKFAWQRALDPALNSPVSGDFSIISGASDVMNGKTNQLSGVVADDTAHTLAVTLNSPFHDFPSLVSMTAFSPLPQKAFASQTDKDKADHKGPYFQWEDGVMVGDGAFKMSAAWNHDQDVVLNRSETYYGGLSHHTAYVDSVVFKVSKSVDSAFTDFQTGGAKVGRIPPGQYGKITVSSPSDLLDSPLLSTEYWGFNMANPTVGGDANKELRKAIALAINKQDIVNKVYGGAGKVATGWAPPGAPGYNVALVSGNRNVDAAKDLLKAWGKTHPDIKISFLAGAGHDEKASIIQQNLGDIGVKATLDPLDLATFKKAMHDGTLQFFRGNWTADYASYDNFLAPLFASPPLGDQNVFGYSNSAFDTLIERARGTADDDQRSQQYRDAEKMIIDDQVVVPIDWPTARIVTTSAVHGVSMQPLGFVLYGDAWVQS